MAPLHAPPAPLAPAEVQIKSPDDDARDWQVFLVLRGDGRFNDPPSTGRTLRRERHVVLLVDLRRTSPTGFRAVGTPRLPPWTLWMRLQWFGERGGLPEPGSPRLFQFSFQVIDLVPESFLLALQLVTLPSQRLPLAFRVFGTLAPVDLGRSAIRFARFGRLRHAAVMPEFGVRYKTR
jgi:hypothetical protein